MTVPTFPYARVTGRIAVMVADTTADPDAAPDLVWADAGTVTLTPLVPNVRSQGIIFAPQPIICSIDANGYISLNGSPAVYVLDLGAAGINPVVPRDVAAYQVSFSGLSANGQTFSLPSFGFNPDSTVPDNDLASVMPVSAGTLTAAVPITIGPRGLMGPPGDPINSDKPAAAIAQTLPRTGVPMANSSVLASGRLTFIGIRLQAGQLITSVTFFSATTPVATPTSQWFEIRDSNLELLAQTVDDGTNPWAANAQKTLNLTQPWNVPTDGTYYLGICVVAATVPTLTGAASAVAGSIINLMQPPICSIGTTGLTSPASSPGVSIFAGALGPQLYAYVS